MSALVRPIDVAVSTKAAIQGNWLAHGGGFAWVDRPFSRSANSHWTFFCLNLLYVTLPHANGLTALMLLINNGRQSLVAESVREKSKVTP